MNIRKKIISIVTISIFLFTVASPAMALTAEELQAQITILMAQLATLQSELAILQGGTGTTVTGCTITSFDIALKLGMSGDDVKCLQIILNSSTDTQLAPSGVGSSGNETTYFGPLTKAAVITFQEKYASEILESWGLTSGTGFVGSTTRAKLNTLLVVVPTECTVDADCPAGYTCTATTCVQIPTAAGLTVALSATTPATGVVITSGDASPYIGQALVPFTTINFTAGSEGSVTVTTLRFKRIGISADANFDNTYLYEGDAKLIEGGTISSTFVSFNDSTGIFTVPAGQTRSITLKANLNYDVSAGKTMSFNLVEATDITSDASAVNGTFPISGRVMSVANATDLGYAGLTAGTTPNALDVSVNPQDDYEVWRVTILANNQDLEIEKLVFTEVGSILVNDLQDFKLYYGGILIGTAEMDSNYQVIFDLSASPFSITKGTSKIVKLYADIVKGSTRTFKFTLQYPTDFIARDANYGVYIPAYVSGTWAIIQPGTAGVGNYKIAAGSMSVTKTTDSPVSNVAFDATNVSLAKYEFKAVGEDIKVSTLSVTADTSAGDAGLDNGKIYLDGVQVGSTKDLTEYPATATSFTFGTSFIVLAGTTSVVEIKADIKTAATASLTAGETITIYLQTGSSNAQGQSSLTVLPIPASNKTGNALTVQAGTLTFTKRAGYGAQTTVAPTTEFKMGSFSMLAGSSDGVNVDSITVNIEDTASAAKLENLLLKIGADQIGSLKVTPSISNLFSVNVALDAGESKVVDVYADVLSGVAAEAIDTDGIEVVGTGTTIDTSTAANASSITLQIITVASSALNVNIASDTPDDALVVGPSTDDPDAGQNVIMAKYKFSAVYEAYNVSEIRVYASSEKDRFAPRHDKGNLDNFVNVWLSYEDSAGVTRTTTKRATFVNGMMYFTGMSMYVPANGTANLTIYADLNAVAATGYALAGSRPQISLASYKANSGSISALERRVGVFYYGGDATTLMSWVADGGGVFDETNGDYALRFIVAGGAGDGAEFDVPLRDMGLTVADIVASGGTITYSAKTTVANTLPLFSLWVDCDDDGTFDGEIMWHVESTIAADTWTAMTITGATTSDNTGTVHEWWSGNDACGTGASSGDLELGNFPDQDAQIIGASFGIYTGSNAAGTYDVDNLVITAGGTSYVVDIEDDMGALGTNYVLYKTKPTVTMLGAVSESTLVSGTNVLYSFNVAADPAGDVGLKVITFNITGQADMTLNTLKLYKGSTDYTDKVTIGDDLSATNSYESTGTDLANGSAKVAYVVFTTEEVISAGDDQDFYLKGLAASVDATSSVQIYMTDDAYLECKTDIINVCLARAYASVSNDEFIWSDRSYDPVHTLLTSDWLSGFLVKTLGDSLVHTISQ